jgi:pimeloyl-ACP methyl ester carboxylesterase
MPSHSTASKGKSMAEAGAGNGEFRSVFVTAPDGLRLHVRAYGSRLAPSLPLVCLPGLARSSADFHALACALATHPETPRYVLALDYRGRGQSDYDRDPRNYTLATELADLLAILTALEVPPAVFLGTSRGGLLTMMLASARPAAIAGAVLNDIGPVIEPEGLVRIKSYVGKLPRPASYEEGAEILRRLFGGQFTKLSDDDWLGFSRATFKVEQRSLGPVYDVRLARALEGIDLHRRLPPLWAEFDALGRVPLMAIRGANSDILSEETVSRMRARRPQMKIVSVPDQGHAPLLTAEPLIRMIGEFAASCEVKPTAAFGRS